MTAGIPGLRGGQLNLTSNLSPGIPLMARAMNGGMAPPPGGMPTSGVEGTLAEPDPMFLPVPISKAIDSQARGAKGPQPMMQSGQQAGG